MKSLVITSWKILRPSLPMTSLFVTEVHFLLEKDSDTLLEWGIAGAGHTSHPTHSSTLAWKIPWTKEPGWLHSMGSLRVRHDWVSSLSRTGEGNGSPLQCSCLENPRDCGAWWAAVYGVAQSRTRLKWLSSSSSSRWQHLNKLVVLGSQEHFLSWKRAKIDWIGANTFSGPNQFFTS